MPDPAHSYGQSVLTAGTTGATFIAAFSFTDSVGNWVRDV